MTQKSKGPSSLDEQLLHLRKRIRELEKELAEYKNGKSAHYDKYSTSINGLEQFFHLAINALHDHICVLDEDGTIVAVNNAWRIFAVENPPVNTNVAEGANYLAVCDSAQGENSEIARQAGAAIRAIIHGKSDEFSIEYPCHSLSVQRWFIARITRFTKEGRIWVVITHEDITGSKSVVDVRRLNEMRLNSLLHLALQTQGLSEKEIISNALEEAVQLTGSKIGYFHFFNEDQDTVQLTAWSRDTMKGCTAVYEKHYPLSQAGVWADCARLRKPVIHNDYRSLSDKHGLPEGHTEIIRHMSVPVIDDDRIRLVTGVGNKESNYDETDLKQLQLLANTVWLIIQRRRALVELQKLVSIVETSTDFISISDLDGKLLYINEAGKKLVGLNSILLEGERDLAGFVTTEDKERLSCELLLAILKKGSWTGELQLKHFVSGKAIPVDTKAFRIGDPETGEPIAMATICRDATERKKTEMILQEMASLDPLTGILNRRYFFDLAFESFKQAHRYSWNLAILMIDIDNFKLINDNYGHAAGDKVLTSIVDRLKVHLRDSDIFCRYGGEEFIILMPSTDNRSAALAAERLRLAIAEDEFKTDKIAVSITLSIGIASLDRSRDFSIDDLVKRADEALYQAKQAGRNCIYVSDKTGKHTCTARTGDS